MLSIGVKVGSRVELQDSYQSLTHIVEVVDIRSAELIIVKVDGGESKVITDQSREEILPNVFVQAGSSDHASGVRIGFDAPRNVKIVRLNKAA